MTAGALSALAPSWDDHPDIAHQAVEYLLAAQQPDGTFERSWSLSEANAVFRALHALHTAAPHEPEAVCDRIRHATELAVSRLTATQNTDGGWGHQPGEPSDPISTSYALLSLRDRPLVTAHGRGIGYLLGQQRQDGGFLSRPDQAAPRPLPYDVPVVADIFVLWALNPSETPEGLAPPVLNEDVEHGAVQVDGPPIDTSGRC